MYKRLQWNELTTISTQPSDRSESCSSFTFGHWIIFGGRNSDTPLNDLYTYNIELNHWQLINPDGEIPSPRYGSSLTHIKTSTDNETSYFLLLGGKDCNDTYFSDCFVLEVSKTNQQTLYFKWTKQVKKSLLNKKKIINKSVPLFLLLFTLLVFTILPLSFLEEKQTLTNSPTHYIRFLLILLLGKKFL